MNEIHTEDDHSTSPAADAIKEGTGQTAWVSPAHDAAGNMTSGPKAGDETTRLHSTYDAWNRMVAVKKDDGQGKAGDTVAVYRYDGLYRRIAKAVANGENWDRTDYYYNESWQCLEERFASAQQSPKPGDASHIFHNHL